jgi:two-component system cell cycle sensor histidine kinase PleC
MGSNVLIATLGRKQKHERFETAQMPQVFEALDCLRVAITVFDAEERLIYVSEHFNHMFRSLPPRQTLLGKSYEELIRLEIAGGEIAAGSIDVENFVAHRRAQFVQGEYAPRDIPLSDGRIVEIKARRTKSGGWIALWSDVTGARLAYARLQKAIELSADAFAFFGRNDELVLCNEEYAAIHGKASPEQMIGHRFRDLLEKQVARRMIAMPEGAEAWLARRLEQHGEASGAMTIETADGTAYLMRDRATEDGGRVIVFTDVTDHKRTEKALAEQSRSLDKTRRALAKSQAEKDKQATYLADLTLKLDRAAAEADTTKTTLLRTMSHELKTPLNAIIGFSDLLATMGGRVSGEQVTEYAGLIHQGGKNLLRLINQILDLTKISAGRYELRRVEIDAGSTLWLAKDAFEARAAAKRIVLDADACPVGLMVMADENAFTAMTHHLIENAVTFTQPGGEVRLSASKADGKVRIAVRDNGPGVAAEDLERILRPFEQGGRSAADHTEGAGLGLTLVKAFSELHGGRLAIESAQGEGFCATVELPAAG